MQTALASEVYALTNLLSRIAASNRRARDFTDNILETVLRHTIAAFPVYRTYIDDRGEYGERDVAFLRYAIARAKRLNPDIDASAFDFLRETLLLQNSSPAAKQKPNPQMLYFALKFQQLTGPVMAKGVEDTAFYVYTRFLSSNEVGGSAKSFGISLETLHQSNQERLKHSPDSMLTTSTHDTKRSEDVRNRLNVLSELPQLWSSSMRRWQRMNAKFKQKTGRRPHRARQQRRVSALPNNSGRVALADGKQGGSREIRRADQAVLVQGSERSQGQPELDQP